MRIIIFLFASFSTSNLLSFQGQTTQRSSTHNFVQTGPVTQKPPRCHLYLRLMNQMSFRLANVHINFALQNSTPVNVSPFKHAFLQIPCVYKCKKTYLLKEAYIFSSEMHTSIISMKRPFANQRWAFKCSFHADSNSTSFP